MRSASRWRPVRADIDARSSMEPWCVCGTFRRENKRLNIALIDDQESSFDGLVSTSNHLSSSENTVWIKTSQPIWWCMELRESGL